MQRPFFLRPDDASDYVAIRREMLLDAPWAFLASPGQDRGSDVEKVRASLERSDAAIAAVREDNRLVAVAGVAREEAIKRRHIAVIWGVYVRPAFRGRGLARAVVEATFGFAGSCDGVASVHLAVSEHAPVARRLYESMGFVQWGYEPDAVRIDGRSFGEHHMAKSVSPA